MVGPLVCKETGTWIEMEGTIVSQPYLDMTYQMMCRWRLPIWKSPKAPIFRVWHVGSMGWSGPPFTEYRIEPDASSASYWFAAAAITQGKVTVPGLGFDSLQGDVLFVNELARMGCASGIKPECVVVYGRPLRGIDVDMNDISDTVMTLAAVACFAEEPTTIRNVAHIRHKETDRLAALATELRRVGAEVDEFADGLTITPRPLHGAEIETYNDHRMAMSMALVGLKVPGIVIKNPGCVAKTYPGFWDDLEKLR